VSSWATDPMTLLAFPIIVALALYFTALGFVAWYAFVIRKASVLEPIGQYLFFLSLFVVPLPLRVCFTMAIEGDVSPYLPQFAPYIPIAVVLVALSLPVFAMTYYSGMARRLGDRVPVPRGATPGGAAFGVLVVSVLSVLLVAKLAQSVGGLLPFLLLGYKASEVTFGKGYLAVGFPWLIVANVALLECYAMRRQRRYLVAFVLVLALNLVAQAMMGNRALIMYLMTVVITHVHFRIRRLTLRVMLPVLLVGFMALNVLGAIRSSGYTDVDDLVERTSQTAERQSGDKKNFVYTLTIGEFVVPFETLPQFIRTVGVDHWPWFGLSIVRMPAFLVPSAIYPDRPLPLGAWYMQQFYGGGYGLNEGRAFFYLSEGYLNFGPPGVFLFAAIWGVLWGAVHHWMHRGMNRFGTVLIYALLVGFMSRCIAGDLVSLVVATIQQSLAGALLILGLARLFRKGRGNGVAAVRGDVTT
jgi:hypothetical protein